MTQYRSEAFEIAAVVVNAPTWWQTMSDKQWKSVALGNTLSAAQNVSPADGNATTSGYMAADVDQDTGELCLPAIGGHTTSDGSRNAVYALTCRANTPTWSRIKQQSAASQSGDGAVDSWSNYTYPDGSPRSVHGWNALAWGNGYFCHTSMQGMFGNGNFSGGAFTFHRNSLVWANRGLPGASQSAMNTVDFEASSGCYDPVHDRFYTVSKIDNTSQRAWYLDGSTWTWTVPGPSGSTTGGRCQFNWCQCVPEYNYIVAGDTSANRVGIFSTVSNTWVAIKTVSAANPVGSASTVLYGYRPVYHQPSHALLFGCKNEGANILKLNCPADPVTGSFTWSTVTPVAGGVTPPNASGDSPHGRFNIINDIGNGRSVLIYYRDKADAVMYAYRLPAGALV